MFRRSEQPHLHARIRTMPLPEPIQVKPPPAVPGKLADMQVSEKEMYKSKYLRAPPREKKKKERRNIEDLD